MTSRLHLSFPLILFISLILLTLWLDQVTRPLTQTSDDNLYHNPDYIIEDLSGIRINYDRVTQQEFSAERLFHYLDEDVTQMEKINFVNAEPEYPLIRLQADLAEVKNRGKHIFLVGNVKALRGTDGDKGQITLRTNSLHLIPDKSLVKTDQLVTISRFDIMISAIGLEFNNHTGVIQLLTKVRAVNNK